MQATGNTVKAHTAILDRFDANAIVNGRMFFTLFPLRKATLITGVTMLNFTGGNYTASNTNGVAIYSISGTDLIKQREGTSGTFFQSANNAALSINLSSSITLAAGAYVFAYVWSASATTTAPRPYQLLQSLNPEQSSLFIGDYQVPISSFKDGETTFPSTIAINTLARNNRSGYARFY